MLLENKAGERGLFMIAGSNKIIKEFCITYTGNTAVDIWAPLERLLMLSDFNAVVIHFWRRILRVSHSQASTFI